MITDTRCASDAEPPSGNIEPWAGLVAEIRRLAARWQHADAALVVSKSQADLLEIILRHCAGLAPRADWTAGKKSAINTAMIAITTSNSIRVKPRLR